jgi:ribA/ribD-fused uncharacterized protein
MSQSDPNRLYIRDDCVVFRKTNEPFGGLSNMAPSFPLSVAGTAIRTSEALYQACRFPHSPEVQRMIIDQRSPMTAKMKSKPFRDASRPDWQDLRVRIMRWCIRVKLVQHREAFGALLLAAGDRPIVEESAKDRFWGARGSDDGTLTGQNVLGRLLMELRQQLKVEPITLQRVEPLDIPDFLLVGHQIGSVRGSPAAADTELTLFDLNRASAGDPPAKPGSSASG